MKHHDERKSKIGYGAVIAAVYLAWFYPEFFSRPLVVMPVFALLLLKERGKGLLYLFALSLFGVTLYALAASSPEVSVDKSRINALYGSVIQDSSQKKGRSTGYRIRMDAVSDEDGNLFSASGNLYVVAPSSDFVYGDRIETHGRFSEEIFIASSSRLLERGRTAALRHNAVSWIKDRLRDAGSAGELGMRLLLGYGDDGVFALSDNARQSGLSHVLALSGMHLSIIAVIVSKPLGLIFGKKSRHLVSIILFLFSFLSGWRPSLMRAFIFRMLYQRGISMEESFMLSYIILLMIFPESVIDLGAMYSFISLGGIFILSESLDESMRNIIPLPYSFSVSAAASASALLFSIPLTLDVFGSYQLGAIISSFPFSALISLYMWVAIAVVCMPCLSPLLELFYKILEKAFELAAIFPQSDSLLSYLILLASVFSVLLLGKLIAIAFEKRKGAAR